jgi:prevent-host-death family protein
MPMKTATISDAKNRLSELLARVKRGETVLILERDTPIARIEPVAQGGPAGDPRLAELERSGVLQRPKHKPGADLLRKLPPMPRSRGGVLAALLAEREEDR